MIPGSWESRAAAKRASVLSAIPSPWRIPNGQVPTVKDCSNVMEIPRRYLSQEELTITETPPMDTLVHIHAGIWSAEAVVRAYCHRAAIAHQLVNCLTDAFFDTAISAAMQLDQYYRETGSLKGPLHGLPVSFMDRFRITGRETAAGYVSWLGPTETAATESLIVRHMRSLGAIPFCKTNTPQSMMLAETTNNIHGSTHNPYNRMLSSGGAAGVGEGALLALKGSPIGWGTEFAGSTRIPAVFNGLYSLKVSSGRLPMYGVAAARTSLPTRNSTIAMISWDFALLQLLAKLTLGLPNLQEDPGYLDMPWRQFKVSELGTRRPVFAVLEFDENIQPQPPVRRALRNLIHILRSTGYQVIDWKPPMHAPAVERYFRIIGADGAQATREHIKASGEPPVPRLKDWYDNRPPIPLPLPEYLALLEAQEKYQAGYQTYWKSTSKLTTSKIPVDGVIMPVCADAACFENSLTYFGYSAIVNVLDFTAVTFPVGFVDMSLDPGKDSFASLSQEDEAVHQSYNANAFHGCPVGLQLMCRRTEEEKALRLVEMILQAQTQASVFFG
ncbi:hypothetical protein PV08_08144 [Exophiala spinifera]|uniref:Amidase domain-containing protein n=1 Tax=Exophiala spinifera TaxID=91928 RepID=A0A0D1ZJG0_9EURO|nr:uncharacterized protein PV08_08144 [Exophiala spinifera]KIW12957.1 hypothetical protein PV08_08144 [Exophiala spinifera]